MITPKLDLDFTGATLDSRVTLTRSDATATRVNSSGLIETVAADTPRFDFDPVTLACRGLLVEETRNNLYPYSRAFDDSSWTPSNTSVVADQATAPDGTLTADDIITSPTSTSHTIYRLTSIIDGNTYTYSIYVKSDDYQLIALGLNSSTYFGNSALCYFDITDGTVRVRPSFYTDARIVDAGNGWWRISVTGSSIATGNTTGVRVYPAIIVSGTSQTVTFDGAANPGKMTIWGAQFEVGAFPTSYIPTEATTVTRNADVAQMTGTNFSDWWQASKGAALVKAQPGTVSGTRPWIQFDDGTPNEIIALRGNTTNPELYVVEGGAVQAQIDAGTIAANTDYSLTGWWATNDCKARLDSSAVVSDTSATIPTVTQARLGSDGSNYLNGHLVSISYYDVFSQQIYTRRKNKAIFNLM